MNINDYFDYIPLTGSLVHKSRSIDQFKNERVMNAWNTRFADKQAGGITRKGYIQVRINKQCYKAHRIIWEIMTGDIPDTIDHINGNRSDNRWCNLRNVSQQENTKNKKRPKNNMSGCIGVYWSNDKQKWRADIKDKYKHIYLGAFDNINDAIAARKQAEIQYGFHANHGR